MRPGNISQEHTASTRRPQIEYLYFVYYSLNRLHQSWQRHAQVPNPEEAYLSTRTIAMP